MRDWLESIAGPAYATAMLWTLGALALLLVVLLLIKIVRNLTFGTFVAGGRQRKARLAVMDAAAVDSHRRLVLVRRDDVEHLLLIGGPTDVVVEQNIRLTASMRRPAEEPARDHAAPPAAEERPQAVAPAAPQPAAPLPAAAHAAPPATPHPEPSAPARPLQPVTLIRQPAAPAPRPLAPAPRPAPVADNSPSAAPQQPAAPRDLDDALREELEHTLDGPRKSAELPPSVEDEMSRLLGELSGRKR
jgi:hypothetical protein